MEAGMTGLNSFVRTLTGPKCLRSALRRKTGVVHRLMGALNSPTQMQVSIPAGVFGGDIFGVMSEQLREALIVPPPAKTTVTNRDRKKSLSPLRDEASISSENPFPLAVQKQRSTFTCDSFAPAATNVLTELSLGQTTTSRNSLTSSLESHTSRAHSIKDNLREDVVESRINAPEFSKSTNHAPATKHASNTATLTSSLNRYWQSLREQRNPARANQPIASTESTNNTRDLGSVDFEQQATARAWPNFIARDGSKRTGSTNDDAYRADQQSLRSARFDSFADPRHDFNLRTNPANNQPPHYDDLSERLAEILHEQALQHGIDVT